MAPRKAAESFLAKNPGAARYSVDLQGSLASTGRGHMTDVAINAAFEPRTIEINWQPEVLLKFPNGMLFKAFNQNDELLDEWQVYSTGGGALWSEDDPGETPEIYQLNTMDEILRYCTQRGKAFWEYVEECEGPLIWEYLAEVWQVMDAAIDRGISTEGVLPGTLGLARKAWSTYRRSEITRSDFMEHGHLFSYALAVSEENASGGLVVAAPTCGSSGVLPATIRHIKDHVPCTQQQILRALATAGLIGNLIKHNASIAGSVVGCQGEVGAACAMAAGAVVQLLGGTIRQIEYAAEMGLEHHLGLTCDPVDGLVQIPCIERNPFAAARAVSCANFALASDGFHRISFDSVVTVMKQTGHDLPSLYRETANGGLAKAYRFPEDSRPLNKK